jgi:hypothetical protein
MRVLLSQPASYKLLVATIVGYFALVRAACVSVHVVTCCGVLCCGILCCAGKRLVLAGAGLEHQQLVELATPMLKGKHAYWGLLVTNRHVRHDHSGIAYRERATVEHSEVTPGGTATSRLAPGGELFCRFPCQSSQHYNTYSTSAGNLAVIPSSAHATLGGRATQQNLAGGCKLCSPILPPAYMCVCLSCLSVFSLVFPADLPAGPAEYPNEPPSTYKGAKVLLPGEAPAANLILAFEYGGGWRDIQVRAAAESWRSSFSCCCVWQCVTRTVACRRLAAAP